DGLLPIPRGPGKHRSVECFWAKTAAFMVAYSASPQPAARAVGLGHPHLHLLDSSTTRPASLSGRTLSRHSSKVGAVCVEALVRICAGGGQPMIVPTASASWFVVTWSGERSPKSKRELRWESPSLHAQEIPPAV